MRVCHSLDPVFDDPNLITLGGLPAVMTLAEHAGLHDLVDEHVTQVPGTAGANASVKASAIIAVHDRRRGPDQRPGRARRTQSGDGGVHRPRAATTGTHLRGWYWLRSSGSWTVVAASAEAANLGQVVADPGLWRRPTRLRRRGRYGAGKTHGYRKQGSPTATAG